MATSSTSPKLAPQPAPQPATNLAPQPSTAGSLSPTLSVPGSLATGSLASGLRRAIPHRFWLRLTDRRETRNIDLPLFGGRRPSGLDLEDGGVVHESHGYDACLLTDAELAHGEVLWLLNDEDPVTLAMAGPLPVKGPDGEDCLLYQLFPGDEAIERGRGEWKPFERLYGFARMAVRLPGELVGGGDPATGEDLSVEEDPAVGEERPAEAERPSGAGLPLELSTRDVACVCDRFEQEVPVAEMVRELVNAPDSEVVAWMLGKADVGEPGRHPLAVVKAPSPSAWPSAPSSAWPSDPSSDSSPSATAESSSAKGSSESLTSYLDLCEKVLRGYERNLSFLCRHAYSRTVKTEAFLDPSQVRRAGRRELLWLASNPDMLRKTSAKTAVRLGGESYTVARLRTERPTLTFDNRENRALLAFVAEVAASLTDIAAQAQEEAERLRTIGDRLRGLFGGDGLIPSLLVVEASLSREEPLIERACELRRRARKVAATLARALPQVERVRYRLPKRTKPFQEIPVYVELYALMRSWDAFGEFALGRDGLVLHTWRMDKLFEYYLLYLLLSTLRGMGFELDPAAGEPVCMARYSLQSHVYSNEEQVAGVYRLVRGAGKVTQPGMVAPGRPLAEKVTLYYQPVFYADGREEYGVDLHRTTRSTSNPYWTPDYLLVVDTPDGRRKRVVIDAKFRRFDDVRPDYSSKESMEKKSILLECQRKYTLETAGPGGVRPDSVWLLCGRAAKRAFWAEELTDWAREQGILPNGVATAVPGANVLNDMLAAVGIGLAGTAAAPVREEGSWRMRRDARLTPGQAGERADAVEDLATSAEEPVAMSEEFPEMPDGFPETPDGVPEAEWTAGEEPVEKDDEGALPVESALVDGAAQRGGYEGGAEGAEREGTEGKAPAGAEGKAREGAEDDAGTEDAVDGAASPEADGDDGGALAISSDDGVPAEDNQLQPQSPAPQSPAPQPPEAQPAKPPKPPKQPKQPKRQKQPRGDSAKSKRPAQPATPVVDEALLTEVTNLLQALIDRGFKHEHLQRVIGQECKIAHPLIRDRKPDGREARFYSADPVEIGGEPWYVFIDWKPNTLARLRKF